MFFKFSRLLAGRLSLAFSLLAQSTGTVGSNFESFCGSAELWESLLHVIGGIFLGTAYTRVVDLQFLMKVVRTVGTDGTSEVVNDQQSRTKERK